MDKRISEVLFMCMNLYKVNRYATEQDFKESSFYKKVQTVLDGALKSTALLQQSIHPEWEIEEKYPGYLFRLTPPFNAYVPYNLVPIFPSQNTMNDLFLLADKIKTSEKSILCLSGSATTLGATYKFNDIDFCEYIKCSDDLSRVRTH